MTIPDFYILNRQIYLKGKRVGTIDDHNDLSDWLQNVSDNRKTKVKCPNCMGRKPRKPQIKDSHMLIGILRDAASEKICCGKCSKCKYIQKLRDECKQYGIKLP